MLRAFLIGSNDQTIRYPYRHTARHKKLAPRARYHPYLRDLDISNQVLTSSYYNIVQASKCPLQVSEHLKLISGRSSNVISVSRSTTTQTPDNFARNGASSLRGFKVHHRSRIFRC
ncbi:hypothetical protein HRR88_001066 [Exophiala dermatitidis]|nr:hypothetical protein HRR73_005921 [Exophiala dermatitidis]KAJ4548257.1 hypothetical protein HRR76_000861 [Exophiala dermatitidis]KAJ4570213.1 hypothetical protein HRR82_007424 [Exophiala dermatitidis]KAJ4593300.1 hypothetical protein HRR84_006807 [Exophiala dermatitidis]KAJ4611238.1 hypothetical protein HRR85_005068 [Exophiala dermatitidis]